MSCWPHAMAFCSFGSHPRGLWAPDSVILVPSMCCVPGLQLPTFRVVGGSGGARAAVGMWAPPTPCCCALAVPWSLQGGRLVGPAPDPKSLQFTGGGPCEVSGAPKSEHEKGLEHGKKRSRPSLLRPVTAPAKVSSACGSLEGAQSHGSYGSRPTLPGSAQC